MSVSETTHVYLSALFPSDTDVLPGKTHQYKHLNLTFDFSCDIHTLETPRKVGQVDWRSKRNFDPTRCMTTNSNHNHFAGYHKLALGIVCRLNFTLEAK